MKDTQHRLYEIKSHLPAHCILVAVSKTKSLQQIMEVYQTRHLDFGENKVQELVGKQQKLPKDIRWHMIGHLQRNKVKYIAPFVHLIHSVDSIKLLIEINKQAEKQNRIINCLFQVHIAKEKTKFGFDKKELWELLQTDQLTPLTHIKICGLMGMASNSSDDFLVRDEFKNLYEFFKQVQHSFYDTTIFNTLSMGMSEDYPIALKEGSTMIRIGSSIFGERTSQ